MELQCPRTYVAQAWYVYTADFREARTQTYFRSILSGGERSRYERFRFEQDRLDYLVAHGVLRVLLGNQLGRSPGDVTFDTNRYGRPEIADHQARERIRFNLSHSLGLACCVLCGDMPCGIDVERRANVENLVRPSEVALGRQRDRRQSNGQDDGMRLDTLARQFFSRDEAEVIRQSSGREKQQRFLTIWTLKEAYVKARGMGLSLPLDSFSMQLHNDEQTEIRFEDSHFDDPASWCFHRRQIDEDSFAAIALRTGQVEAIPVQWKRLGVDDGFRRLAR